MTVCFWPILLKKSASISTAEKYASEIEIEGTQQNYGYRERGNQGGANVL
jgi:hypothetical protein